MAGFHLFPWHSVNKFVCFNSNGSIIWEVLIICNGSFWSVQSLSLRSIGIQRSYTTLSRFTTLFMVILDHLCLKVGSGWWGGIRVLVMSHQDIWFHWAASHSSNGTTIGEVKGEWWPVARKLETMFKNGRLVLKFWILVFFRNGEASILGDACQRRRGHTWPRQTRRGRLRRHQGRLK